MNNRIMISLLTAAVVFAQSPLSFVQAADDTSVSLKPEYSLSGNILPAGIPGLPDDYDLPEREMDEKVQMMEHDVLQDLGSMTADEDYRDGLVYTYAETEEEATAYAEAFNGTIKVYSEKIVTIELPSDVSVLQAVSASFDPTCTKLPCVSPVYKIYLDPREKDGSLSSVSDGSGDSLFSVGGPSGTSGLSYEDHILNDYVNDPYLLHPEELYNDNNRQYQWHHDMVNTWEAWTYGYGDPAIKVGVIDTGVFADHEDLKGNVKAQYDYCTYDDSDENYVTDNHGTHVAGIIGASVNNGKGGSGIAPGVSIYSYNVFVYDGGANSDDQARAVRDCADKGMDVVNMSLGGIGLDPDMLAAVTYAWEKGVTIFAAMGNDSTSMRKYPACYDHVVSVSNLARDGQRSISSTYGSWCDLAAPGTDIISTVCVMNGSTVTNKTNAYESFTGTSMSTPVATGVAALYMSRYGNPGPDQMEKLMKKYSQKCSAKGCGALIDAGKLMASGSVPVPGMRLYTKTASYDVDRSGSLYEDITEFTLSDPLSSTGPLSRSLVYTLDGKNPTSDSHISYTGTVDLLNLGLAGGSVVTLKAAVLDETGKIGKILSVKLKLPADSVTEAANKAENVGIVVNDDTEKKPITKYTMSYSGSGTTDRKSFTAVITDSLGNELALDQVKHKWITSDPSVVFLSEKDSGVVYLYPGKKGKAKISLKLLDGSGKTAVCNVTVEQSVTGISISGQDSIAPGKSASFKASVYPTDAKNKKVEWA
ncbi:MAG: S8 family serine peptidase, partial [Lachnospiraceae bacterium]|nr:S8 family serine peptidase [Lachnospiraceae bacterium]